MKHLLSVLILLSFLIISKVFKFILFIEVLITFLAINSSKFSVINFSKIDLPNAKTLLIEALCQNFPIVLGIALALEIPEVAIYGMIYYLTSMVFAVSYSFSKKY